MSDIDIQPLTSFALEDKIYAQVNCYMGNLYFQIRRFTHSAGGLPIPTTSGISMYPGVWGNLRLKFEEIASLRVELLKRDLGSTASVLVYLDPKGYPILRVRMTKVTESSLSYMIMRVLDGKNITLSESGWGALLSKQDSIRVLIEEKAKEIEEERKNVPQEFQRDAEYDQDQGEFDITISPVPFSKIGPLKNNPGRSFFRKRDAPGQPSSNNFGAATVVTRSSSAKQARIEGSSELLGIGTVLSARARGSQEENVVEDPILIEDTAWMTQVQDA